MSSFIHASHSVRTSSRLQFVIVNRIVALELVLCLIHILNSLLRKYIWLKDIFITILVIIFKIFKWLIWCTLYWESLDAALFFLLVFLPCLIKRWIPEIVISNWELFALVFVIIWERRTLSHLWFYLCNSLLYRILRKLIVLMTILVLLIIEERFLDVVGSHIWSKTTSFYVFSFFNLLNRHSITLRQKPMVLLLSLLVNIELLIQWHIIYFVHIFNIKKTITKPILKQEIKKKKSNSNFSKLQYFNILLFYNNQ